MRRRAPEGGPAGPIFLMGGVAGKDLSMAAGYCLRAPVVFLRVICGWWLVVYSLRFHRRAAKELTLYGLR